MVRLNQSCNFKQPELVVCNTFFGTFSYRENKFKLVFTQFHHDFGCHFHSHYAVNYEFIKKGLNIH